MSQAGELIRAARLRSGISQRRLATRAGTSQAAISRIERGQEEPTLERLEQILAGLGWRPVIALEPLAQSDAELRRLYENQDLDPGERLERGLHWAELTRELAGSASGRPVG